MRTHQPLIERPETQAGAVALPGFTSVPLLPLPGASPDGGGRFFGADFAAGLTFDLTSALGFTLAFATGLLAVLAAGLGLARAADLGARTG